MSKQELIDEENEPKSRKLNDQENVTTEVDTTSTVKDCQILSSDSYADNKDKRFINTGMSSNDADAKACSQSCGNNHQPNYGTLCEMFPQVCDSEVKEALDNASGNIEVAVSHFGHNIPSAKPTHNASTSICFT